MIIRDNKTRRKLLWKRQVLISFDNRQKEANVDTKRIGGRKLRREQLLEAFVGVLHMTTKKEEEACCFTTQQEEDGRQEETCV